MAYASLWDGGVGAPPIQLQGLNTNDTTALQQPGMLMAAVDPYWGAGEFIYGRANGDIPAFALCSDIPVFSTPTWRHNFTVVPDTANLGKMVAVAMTAMAAGEFGWFQITGLTPVDCAASVAADTAWGIGAAGQGGAISAGKQILNSRIAAPATTTVAKTNCSADSGSLFLQVTNSDGWFEGAFLSGTGIAALTRVASIAQGGRTVTLSVATTAAVTGTVTATYNNATIYYNVAHLNRSFAQGQDAT